MSLDPRDLHNLLPPDLVAAVEDAEFIARARIENNRDVDDVDTLRDDVRALATLVRIRKTVADFTLRHGKDLPPPIGETSPSDPSNSNVRGRSEAESGRLESGGSDDDVSAGKETHHASSASTVESLLSPFLARELVKHRRELRAAMSAHLTTQSLKRPPLFAADVDRLSRFVSLHLTLAETTLAHARAGAAGSPGLDAWAALALDLPVPPSKKIDDYVNALKAAEAAGFVRYSDKILTTDLQALERRPGKPSVALFDFDPPPPHPDNTNPPGGANAFDPFETLRKIERTETALDSLRPSRGNRTSPHVVWPRIPSPPEAPPATSTLARRFPPAASTGAPNLALGRTSPGSASARPADDPAASSRTTLPLTILRPLDYFPSSFSKDLGIEAFKRATGRAASALGRFHLRHHVSDETFTFLARLRRSLNVTSRPRGLPVEFLDISDGPPLTEEEFWAAENAFAPP